MRQRSAASRKDDRREILAQLSEMTAGSSWGQPWKPAQEAVEALQRLDAGAYGTCTDCNREIPKKRLRAKPEAVRCLQCQREIEQPLAAQTAIPLFK